MLCAFRRHVSATPQQINSVNIRQACIAGVIATLACNRASWADTAASVNSQGLPIAFSSVNVSHGWRFTPTVPIRVTALGLLDADNDGFAEDHPIGLWKADGDLLVSSVINAGTVDPLVNRFRYAVLDPSDQPILTPGVEYTIGYFLSAFNVADGFVVWNGVHSMHPAIAQIGTSFATFGDELTMPQTPNSLGSQCFGPNFQFTIVPAPGAIGLWLLAGMRPGRRRMRT